MRADQMLPYTSCRAAAFFLVIATTAACSGGPQTSPVTTAPSQGSGAAAHAAIAITSISVASERAAAGGYVYRTVLQLRESAGVAARIDAVDLTFMKGADVVMSARHDQPIPATGNMVSASGTAATRELITSDVNPAHAYATSVAAKITFTDTTAGQAATAGSADVPPPSDPQPVTYTLTGVITDQAPRAALRAHVSRR